MPIYEYQCTECEYKLEALQKIADSPLVDCPECSQSTLKKLVSAASFRLKGGGWYKTDFKTGDKKQLADSDSQPKTDSNDGAGSAEKTKPAGKEAATETAATTKKENKSTSPSD